MPTSSTGETGLRGHRRRDPRCAFCRSQRTDGRVRHRGSSPGVCPAGPHSHECLAWPGIFTFPRQRSTTSPTPVSLVHERALNEAAVTSLRDQGLSALPRPRQPALLGREPGRGRPRTDEPGGGWPAQSPLGGGVLSRRSGGEALLRALRFLITYLLLEELRKTGTVAVKSFYLRRVCRIWPLYFAVVAFGLVFYFALLPALGLERSIDRDLRLADCSPSLRVLPAQPDERLGFSWRHSQSPLVDRNRRAVLSRLGASGASIPQPAGLALWRRAVALVRAFPGSIAGGVRSGFRPALRRPARVSFHGGRCTARVGNPPRPQPEYSPAPSLPADWCSCSRWHHPRVHDSRLHPLGGTRGGAAPARCSTRG